MFFLILFFLQSLGFAMKPAPFTSIEYTDEASGFVLYSDPEKDKTIIKKSNGETLWVMDEFIGRKVVNISPDGSLLLLFGSKYFGSILSSDESIAVLVVYAHGKKIKELNFSQFFGMTISEATHTFLVPRMGGGWIAFMRYVEMGAIDWNKRIIPLSFQNKTSFQVSF
jgi:hypothetical protein